MSVFNELYNAITTSYPTCTLYSRHELVIESYPCVFVQKVNSVRPRESADLDNQENVKRESWEVESYAKSSTDAYGIMSKAEEKMKALGYFEESCYPINNIDPDTLRIVARFSKIVCGG